MKQYNKCGCAFSAGAASKLCLMSLNAFFDSAVYFLEGFIYGLNRYVQETPLVRSQNRHTIKRSDCIEVSLITKQPSTLKRATGKHA